MGVMTTMKDLAVLWSEMTAEERLDYRVRFPGDDVLEIISITTGDDDQAAVRGYQLNGALAAAQRDENSRAMRVRMFPLNLGGVEILDHGEPIERLDPGPPPVRLTPDGEYERIEEETVVRSGYDAEAVERITSAEPDLSAVEPRPELPGSVSLVPERTPWDYAQEIGEYTFDVSKIEVLPGREGSDLDPPSQAPLAPRVRECDTPIDEWSSTSVRLPRGLLDRAQAAARERMVGRNKLLAFLLEEGLDRLESRPPLGN